MEFNEFFTFAYNPIIEQGYESKGVTSYIRYEVYAKPLLSNIFIKNVLFLFSWWAISLLIISIWNLKKKH